MSVEQQRLSRPLFPHCRYAMQSKVRVTPGRDPSSFPEVACLQGPASGPSATRKPSIVPCRRQSCRPEKRESLSLGDSGTHTVCAIVTQEFLDYSASKGNDLMTPVPHWQFPGLKPGDHWCLCISRWLQAEKVGKAPPIVLEATHEKSLKYTSLELLKRYGIEAI